MSQPAEQPKVGLIDQVCPALFHAIESSIDRVEIGQCVTFVTRAGEQTSSVARHVQSGGHTIARIERSDGVVEITVRKARTRAIGRECCPGGDCR